MKKNDDERFLLCGSVSRVLGSVPVKCCKCGSALVASPASLAAAPGASTICMPCASAMGGPRALGPALPLTTGQLREIEGYLRRN